MASIHSKNTKPEMVVRRILFGLGFRYRLHRKDLPGTPDIAFISREKAIFVHGCFWHTHQECKSARIPKSNVEYWVAKLRRNQERDLHNQLELTDSGWGVLVVWECETKDPDKLQEKLLSFLAS